MFEKKNSFLFSFFDFYSRSFGEVSSRVQNLLDSMQEIAENNILTTKDVLVQLVITAIKTLNAVRFQMIP